MLSIRKVLQIFQNNHHMRQSANLFFFNLVGLPLGFITNIVITRYMGAENYGNYLYILKIFEFAYIVFNLGLFRSINRAILLSKSEMKKRQYYGSSIIILGIISIEVLIGLSVFAFIMPDFKEKGIMNMFFYLLPFCFIFYLNHLFEQVLPANNRIDLLIQERYGPKLAFFILSSIIYCFFDNKYNPIIVIWFFFLTSQFIIYLFILYKLKPLFFNIHTCLKEIFDINKKYGIHIYLGDIGSTAVASIMPLLIGSYCNTNIEVGYYSLSILLCSPLSYIPVVIATSHYSSFSHYKCIPIRLFFITLALSVFAFLILLIIVKPFINTFYTIEFMPVINLTYIVSIGALFYALSDFVSRFLASQGDGKSLRNSSWIVGTCTLIGSIWLIPNYHAYGAAITYIIAGTVYFLVILYYYRKKVILNKYSNIINN